MLVSIVPIVCLCGLILYQLIRATQIRNDAQEAKDDAYNFLKIDSLIQSLQVGVEIVKIISDANFFC